MKLEKSVLIFGVVAIFWTTVAIRKNYSNAECTCKSIEELMLIRRTLEKVGAE